MFGISFIPGKIKLNCSYICTHFSR